MAKRAILMMAYGSPNTLEDIEPYYTDIRRGRKPTPELLHELTERYKAIGIGNGNSPLLNTTIAQAENLEKATGIPVYLGMRHWNPWIREAVLEMKNDGVDEVIGVVMAPHYSEMSIARYVQNVEDGMKLHGAEMNFSFIKSWHNHPLFISALNEKIDAAMELFNKDEEPFVIFTAHSLPEKILLNNDPYKIQLLETCDLLSEMADIPQWSFAFQSAGRTEEKWLGPDLLEEIKKLSHEGVKSILVCSVGFITDHLEVMYDIDIEAKKYAADLGIHLERTASLNAHPLIAETIKDILEKDFNI